MNTNREIKIAIAVGLIMITGCIVAFIIARNNNNPNVTLDIHIYKHIGDTNNNSGKYYECAIESDKLPRINNEFKRIHNLKDSNKVIKLSANIEGIYKVSSGSNFIAFDANGSSYVYRGDTTAVYEYPSEIYDEIAAACSYITEESVKEAELEAQAKEEKTEEKEDTKKTDKSSKKTSKTTKAKKTTKK